MRRVLACGVLGATVAAGCAGGGERIGERRYFHLAADEIAEAAHGSRALFLRDYGDAAVRDERYADARVAYEEARLYQYGDDFETQVALGELYERDGDVKAAVAAYSRAAYLRPGHLAGWYHLERVVPHMPQLRSEMDAAAKPADAAAAPPAG
jgi:tetratricopeptide (TPR) repeat protein